MAPAHRAEEGGRQLRPWHDHFVHPGDRHYRNQLVRLPDLAVTDDVIRAVTFENCTLVGPAVIILLGTGALQDSGFDGDAEGVLWPLGDRSHVIGAIGLEDCAIISCRLQRIGLAYPPHLEEMVRQGLGLA